MLGVILFFGQKLMRPLFLAVAHRKSSELFMLTVLLVTLGLAWLTAINGLSMALGAFLAGMLISETEYRYQVEADIKPFRDVLLGLFFVTVGMQLDFHVLLANLPWVLLVFVALLAGKALLVAGLAMLRGAERHVAVRAALALGQAGEFGFVLLALAADVHLVGPQSLQVVLAAMVLSMLAAPFIIHYNEFLARRLAGGEWADRAVQLHEVAIRSVMANQHVILCGYGRSGQYLARFLEQEGFSFIALDVDPQRVKAAAAAGESVVYGDAARREVLMAAGLNRARAVVVSFADTRAARNILSEVLSMRPGLPVVVRTLDDSDLDSLKEAGAAEVVPEILEGSLMLAFHTLMLLGVPLARVVRRARQVREARYDLLRGFFHGATDADFELNEKVQPRLQSLVLAEGMYAVGKTLAELDLESLLVEVTAVRRRGIRALAPQPEARLEAGDVLILKGTASDLAAAEARLTRG